MGSLAKCLHHPKTIKFTAHAGLVTRWQNDLKIYRGSVLSIHREKSAKDSTQKKKPLLENKGLVFVKDKLDLKLCQWGNLEEDDAPGQTCLF
jgi:hypothetical protein